MPLEMSKISVAYQLFFHAIINKSFKELATATYSLLHFPTIIFDSMSHCLAQVPTQDIGDPDYLDTMQAGKSSNELFHKFSEKYFSHPETRDYPLLINDGELTRQRQFLSALYSKGRLTGYTSVLLSSSSYTDEDVEIIKLFNESANYLLLQQESTNNSTNTDTQLFHDILACANDSAVNLESEVNHLKYRLPGAFYIIVCPSSLPLAQSNHICLETMQTDPNCVATYYNNNIVILIGKVTELDFSSRLAALQTYLKKFNLRLYISNSFDALTLVTIQSFYQQALLTVQCAEKNHDQNTLVHYSSYSPQQLFNGVKNFFHPDTFVCQKIYQLQEYDRENSTSYYKTLKIFLSSMKNYKETAKQLYVHPNTISYRVNRLNELFDISFEDEKENLLLLLSCLLLDS